MIEQTLFHWITIGTFNIDMAFRLDSLNTLFTLVITGVGTLIHLYSIGYMGHDETPGKFFSYLNLFCFAMLMLVLGASLPIAVPRLGRRGALLLPADRLLVHGHGQGQGRQKSLRRQPHRGLRLPARHVHDLQPLRHARFPGAVTRQAAGGRRRRDDHLDLPAALCRLHGQVSADPAFRLVAGRYGRPDSGFGPHPRRHDGDLGHLLVSRLNFFYSLRPRRLPSWRCVGVFTAFFAATIAFVQTRHQEGLAYSTVSQLGYMFLACGVGAYSAGVFHVITHAFFKALLFLGAGSVIHGMHEEQDILKMGGLKKYMPVTYWSWSWAGLRSAGFSRLRASSPKTRSSGRLSALRTAIRCFWRGLVPRS